MKQIILTMLYMTFSFAGFFNETASVDKAEYLENERLCKLFIQKAEDYKKTMRADFLAATTLASYEHRADLFCKKADIVKNALSEDTLEELNITQENNITEQNISQ